MQFITYHAYSFIAIAMMAIACIANTASYEDDTLIMLCMHVYVHVCVCVPMHARVCIRVCTHMRMHAYVYACV